MQKPAIFLFLCAALLANNGCGNFSSDYQLTMGGGSNSGSEYPGFVFGTPNLIKVSNQPGILFSWIETPDGERQITYMALFAQGWDTHFEHADSLGENFVQNVTITHGERKLEIAYRMQPESADQLNASMTLDSNPIDLANGRLFLIEDSADGAFKQLKIDFPGTEASLRKPDEIRTYALQAVKQLRQNKEVDDFCRKTN